MKWPSKKLLELKQRKFGVRIVELCVGTKQTEGKMSVTCKVARKRNVSVFVSSKVIHIQNPKI